VVNVTLNTDSVNITGLIPNTIYQWRIATKCKRSTVVYSDYSAIKQFTTGASFAVTSPINETDLQREASGITVYPNPATNDAVVQFNLSKASNYGLEITDASGKVCKVSLTKYHQGKIKLQ